MRRTLVEQLIKLDDDDTYFLTADVGYGVLEPLKEKMGHRFINVGIAEQSMIGIASGLALSGKKVYTYTMCAFYLRALEQIKLDLCYQGANVTMIGVGTGYDYGHLGTTHFALEDAEIIGLLRNIAVATPKDKEQLIEILQANKFVRPTYIRISRFAENGESGGMVNTEYYPKEGGSREYFLNATNEDKKSETKKL